MNINLDAYNIFTKCVRQRYTNSQRVLGFIVKNYLLAYAIIGV